MKYTVLWNRTAEAALTKLWLTARDRNAVSEAASSVDDLLRDFPIEVGESREFGRRILFEQPLGILYSIESEDRIVRVLRVWRAGPRRRRR
jgi:mRNA-degrading endonuclease RelE of RelBE toxin-antitoxin system